MESCDQDELRNAREKLSSLEDEVELKKKQLQELQDQVQEKTNTLESGGELKAEFLAQIQEAERVKEECHGWSAKEISELKGKMIRSLEHYVRSTIAHKLNRIRSED
jgi:kinetochore protein Spc7/SPC105